MFSMNCIPSHSIISLSVSFEYKKRCMAQCEQWSVQQFHQQQVSLFWSVRLLLLEGGGGGGGGEEEAIYNLC
jgi:hypothetical protein